MAADTRSAATKLLETLQILQEPHMLLEAYLSEKRREPQKKPEGPIGKRTMPPPQEVEADFYINLESFGPRPEEAGLPKEILESAQGKWWTKDRESSASHEESETSATFSSHPVFEGSQSAKKNNKKQQRSPHSDKKRTAKERRV